MPGPVTRPEPALPAVSSPAIRTFRWRRAAAVLAALAVCLALFGACSDDDGGAAAPTSASTIAPGDASAQPPPEGSDGGDGLDDPLVFAANVRNGGRVEVQPGDGDSLCFDIRVAEEPGGSPGASLTTGRPPNTRDVAVLGPPTATDGGMVTWSHVCVPIDRPTLDAINEDPGQFRVEIRTAAPHRVPLRPATIFDLTLS